MPNEENLENTETLEPKQEPKQQEVDPQVEAAMEMGWVPKEEYDGDPKNWVSAETFIARGPLLDRIKEQSRQQKELLQTVEQLKAHNSKVEEAAYKKAVRDLRAERAEALREGEVERVVEIEEQLDEMSTQRQTERQIPQTVNEPSRDFLDWKKENDWYMKDRSITGWADGRGEELQAEGVSPQEILNTIAKEVREKFPNKFRNPNRDTASAVGNGASPGRGSKKDPNAELKSSMSKAEQDIMNNMVRKKIMTEEEYLEQYKLISGVE